MTVAVWIVSGLLALVNLAAGGAKILTPKEKLGQQMAWAQSFSPASSSVLPRCSARSA